MNSQRDKRAAATRTLWWSEIDSSALALSLPHCTTELEMGSEICNGKNDLEYKESARYRAQVQTRLSELMKGKSTENKQGDELGSAMKKELNFSGTVSDNGTRQKDDAVPFVDWALARSMEKNPQGLERMGSGLSVVTGSDGESVACDDLRRYSMSMEEVMRLPSSQYKGVVYQPNVGRWGAQIYEKHKCVWLGTFNGEEDAAMAYDRAAFKVRGRDAMTNFSPVGGGDPAAQSIGKHSKEEIVEMLRKHIYDEDMTMTVDRSATINNAEASGQAGTGLGSVIEENKEHLFDKTVTPSDVGKLNRLVIPKQHAEKYFPLDVDSIEKGLLLNFEDNTRKLWTFRYSYWNSSQSYVLTKGWSRFVKDKKLEVEDIVSFHRGSTQPVQLYISCRRRPPGQPRFRVRSQSYQSKAPVLYPVKGSSPMIPFTSRTRTAAFYNAMPILWPNSRTPDAFTHLNSNSIFPFLKKVGDVDALWSHCSVTALDGARSFYCSEPPTKETDINREGLSSMDLYLNLHKSLNSCDESTHIKPPNPSVNPPGRSGAQEFETLDHKTASAVDVATTKGIRLFGVTLLDRQRFSPHNGRELNLFS